MSTSTTTEYDYDFGVPDDEFDNDVRPVGTSRGGGGGFYDIKHSDGPRTFYFITDPWAAKASQDGSWFQWREVAAWEGLIGGAKLPGGLNTFPVVDQRRVTRDGARVVEWINEGDKDYDPLLALVQPYVGKFAKSKTPRRPVSTKVGFNVVEILEDGTEAQRIFVLSESKGRALRDWAYGLQAEADDPDSFSLIGKQYKLTLFEDNTRPPSIVRVKAPAIVLPDPWDIRERLAAKREQVKEFAESRAGEEIDNYDEAPDFAREPESDDVPESEVQESPVERRELFENMQPPRIRSLLTQAGVEFDSKADKATLVDLAVANGL